MFTSLVILCLVQVIVVILEMKKSRRGYAWRGLVGVLCLSGYIGSGGILTYWPGPMASRASRTCDASGSRCGMVVNTGASRIIPTMSPEKLTSRYSV